MPFARPTLSTLRDQALSDVSNGATLLRRAVLRFIAYAQAGLAWLHYGYLDWISKQSVPFTATDEFLYGWGALKGVFPIAASSAIGSVTFTGTNGAVLPMLTLLTRSDGINYITASSQTVSGGSVTVTAAAMTGGSNTNSDVGTMMTLAQAITGINSTGTVSAAMTGGTDLETADAFRTRMLEVYQNPPMGGSQSDYIEWAEAAGGITRCWVLPSGGGAGTVYVYPMMDDVHAGTGGFPVGSNGSATNETRAGTATGDQLNIANFIYPLQPVTALVSVLSPVADEVDFTIADLDPSDAGTKAAIVAALTAVFRRDAAPGGTTIPLAVEGATNGTMYQSQFTAALDAVPGMRRYTLTAPSSSITSATGHLKTLGTITYV